MADRDVEHTEQGEIIPPELAVKAMRDSGYKNTAYALAELIDNAIQANASQVEVICVEARRMVSQRERRHIAQIAVFDNGEGMDDAVLRKALQFGNGTHLDDRTGIGRFGMGLPNASVSQCRRVTVYTWQHGHRNALKSYLDLDEIEQKKTRIVPRPVPATVPDEWIERVEANVGRSGTLVIWEAFDEHRLTWKSAKPTLSHTEDLVGRIYRKVIHDGTVAIRLCVFEGPKKLLDAPAKANDPLYLMASSSTPAPFDKQPMFQRWGDQDEEFSIRVGGQDHKVVVRASWARPETVPSDGRDRGAWPYGRHAAKNVGVSVVRAARELELDSGWANPYASEERWWGIEVDFPPALDEIFGVTNNKQAARTFSAMAQFDWQLEREEGENRSQFLDRLRADNDPRALLVEIADYIRDQISGMRRQLEAQTKGSRSKAKRHEQTPDVDDRASTNRLLKKSGGTVRFGGLSLFCRRSAVPKRFDLVAVLVPRRAGRASVRPGRPSRDRSGQELG